MPPDNPPTINPRQLRPAQLLRLVNATPRGTVLSEFQLRRHRNQAGYRLGEGRTVDLFRYAAWLTLQHLQPRAEPLTYEQQKARQAERNAEAVRTAQDIGDLPAVVDPTRKASCERSFRGFCETYFAEVFYLPWSDDHLRVIEKIEKAVRTGGLFAMAMPRGSGKTVLCQTAVLWSALIGATPFVCLIAASAERARDLLENIKIWLETNPLLAADFPEVTYPIQCLERITNRQKGQKYKGEPTRIDWASDRIVLPTIDGSKASGVVISSSGMKGSDIRGQNYARADGQVVRPQLVMVDDPQTTESAWSPSQSQRREAILAGDVLGMAGPGRKIAGLDGLHGHGQAAPTRRGSRYLPSPGPKSRSRRNPPTLTETGISPTPKRCPLANEPSPTTPLPWRTKCTDSSGWLSLAMNTVGDVWNRSSACSEPTVPLSSSRGSIHPHESRPTSETAPMVGRLLLSDGREQHDPPRPSLRGFEVKQHPVGSINHAKHDGHRRDSYRHADATFTGGLR